MKTEVIFSQALSVVNLNLNNNSIIDYCLKKRKEDPKGRILSNNGGWQSNDIFDEEMILQDLLTSATCYANIFASNFSFNDELVVDNFWININEKGNSNSLHEHPKTLITAVYYAKLPENSGHIEFYNPFKKYEEYLNDSFIRSYNIFNSSRYNLFVKEKNLVIFPAWLEHCVHTNESNESRISIAFNFNLKKS